MTELYPYILSSIGVLAANMAEETDWLVVKKHLLLMLSPHDRKLFTTRDQKTKKHHPFNEFENAVRNAWKEITGNTLMMPSDKQMEDADQAGYL